MLLNLTQNGNMKNGHVNSKKQCASNGIHQNGVKTISAKNDYYVSGLKDSRLKLE